MQFLHIFTYQRKKKVFQKQKKKQKRRSKKERKIQRLSNREDLASRNYTSFGSCYLRHDSESFAPLSPPLTTFHLPSATNKANQAHKIFTYNSQNTRNPAKKQKPLHRKPISHQKITQNPKFIRNRIQSHPKLKIENPNFNPQIKSSTKYHKLPKIQANSQSNKKSYKKNLVNHITSQRRIHRLRKFYFYSD